MLMHQINAENAANSGGPSALLPAGPRGVGRLADSRLATSGTRVHAAVRFVDDDGAGGFGASSAPGWSSWPAHTRSEVSVSVCCVWNPDPGFQQRSC